MRDTVHDPTTPRPHDPTTTTQYCRVRDCAFRTWREETCVQTEARFLTPRSALSHERLLQQSVSALVATWGASKTTLATLLLGFWDPKGRLRVG